jgi:predicted transposase YdaD
MPESKTRPEIKFEYIKTNRPPPKNVLQEIAREFEEEAKEKKANEGKQTPSASQKMQNKKQNEAEKRIKNKKKAGGAIKAPTNPGLKKLPTKVRNKMGYMKSGGKVTSKCKRDGIAIRGRTKGRMV